MNDLFIKKTAKSPEISFSITGQLSIKGVSILEDSTEFYRKPLQWIEQYVLEPADKTTIDVDLDFFNTSSQVNLFDILLKLATLRQSGFNVTFNWYYEDEDLKEIGQDIANLLGVDFNFIKK